MPHGTDRQLKEDNNISEFFTLKLAESPDIFHVSQLFPFGCFKDGNNNEVRECLLPLGAEPFVFQFAIQKFKDQDIWNYNFARWFVWM